MKAFSFMGTFTGVVCIIIVAASLLYKKAKTFGTESPKPAYLEAAYKIIGADSTNPDDLLWLGQLLDRSGKPDRAGEVLTRAAEAAPERSDVWLEPSQYGSQTKLNSPTAESRVALSDMSP